VVPDGAAGGGKVPQRGRARRLGDGVDLHMLHAQVTRRAAIRANQRKHVRTLLALSGERERERPSALTYVVTRCAGSSQAVPRTVPRSASTTKHTA
jgi:hypothetical protein